MASSQDPTRPVIFTFWLLLLATILLLYACLGNPALVHLIPNNARAERGQYVPSEGEYLLGVGKADITG